MTSKDKKNINEITQRRHHHIATDKDGNSVFLADNDWTLNLAKRDFPEVEFHNTSEFNKSKS
jgi:peptide chain release factor 3